MADSNSDSHEHAARDMADRQPVRCAVLTISDTRTEATDTGGDTLCERLRAHGHEIADHAIVRDEPDAIRTRLESWIARDEIDAIISTGGTGIARRDTTIEVVRALLARELEGFGELFRMLSWQEVGPAAMLSRAVGGLAASGDGEVLLFALPGSVNAVSLGVDKLLGPQLPHLVWERRR